MRRLLKFLHTIGAIGMMGALACLIVLMTFVPPPARLAEYALMYGAMAKIATWVFFPSLVVTVISGLLSIGATPAFHEAGWAWAKLATSVLILESGMVYIQGPIKEEASRAASALAGELNPAEISGSYGAENNTLWFLLAVSAANVALGIWRPRFSRRRA